MRSGMLVSGPLLVVVSLTGCAFWEEPDVSVLDVKALSKSHVTGKGAEFLRVAPKLGSRLSVDDAVAIALSNNADIGQARARLLQAKELIRQARAAFLPSLDVGGDYTRLIESRHNFFGQFGPGSGSDIFGAEARLSYNLFSGGRDLNNLRIARDTARATDLLRRRTDEEVSDAVRQAFYQAILAHESIAIARASIAFSNRELKDARARFEVGRGLKTDVLTFETRYLEAQVDVSVRTNAYRLSRVALAELMAINLPDDVELVTPPLSESRWERMPEEKVEQRAWETRADMRALRRDYAAAVRNIHVAQSEFYPQLDLSSTYDMQRLSSIRFDHDDDQLTAGVRMDWNLFAGGATRAAVREARHKAEEIAERYRALKLKIRTEVSNARFNIQDARRRVELGQKTVTSAQENLRLLTDRYRAGAITISQVTEGELRLTEARQQLIKAKIDLLQAQSELRLAIGAVGPEE